MLKEEPLNAYLAEIIGRSHALIADPEVTLLDGRMDVLCRVGDQTVGIEAKLGYRPAQQRAAIADANRRLVHQHCEVAVALLYPSGQFANADDLRAGEVRVNVRSKPFAHDDPAELRLQSQKARWDTVSVASLADYLGSAPSEAGSPETLATMADVAVDSAFAAFTPNERASILADMELSGSKYPDQALKGLLTDLMTAVMFHCKLDVVRHTVAKPSDDWDPPRVIDCINSRNIQASLRSAHAQWIAVDYKQILAWSCSILDSMPPTASTRSALFRIAQAAWDIEQSSGGEHHDLFGITFCQSVESAKNDGSMYTTIPAATLLTRLVLSEIEDRIDWTNFDQVTGLRIVDFACGTGTLLIAAANYILGKERTGRHDDVARALLEQVLYGFDINERAIFQSATGLGMISPSVAFRSMHLYSMLLGLDKATQTGRVGSLELLEGLDQGTFTPTSSGTRIDSDESPIEVGKFDVAIMNPPFTVNYKRHHQFDDEVKEALQVREGELSEGTAINRAGNSGAFMVLADRHLDEENGILGFVLPSAALNGPSGRKVRLWLAERFHIKYLVVSYDPDRIYFSGNTKIGEMLVVAVRKRGSEEPPPTLAVKLTVNPEAASSAVATAGYIVNATKDVDERSQTYEIPYSRVRLGDWNALQFVDNELYDAAMSLRADWGSTVGDQFEVDGIGRVIRRCGDRLHRNIPGALPALWEHDARHCNSLVVSADSWVKAKPGSDSDFRQLRSSVRRLKLPDRIRLTSSCVTALLTDEPSLGSAWQNIVVNDTGEHGKEDVEKVVAMVMNSTMGKLAMLLVRNNKIPSYPAFSIAALRSIALPNIAEMTAEQVRSLVNAFDELATLERKPFPEAHICDVQHGIDAAVCEALEFDLGRCEDLRNRLAREPMISNKPY